jgi:hypothetical protein
MLEQWRNVIAANWCCVEQHDDCTHNVAVRRVRIFVKLFLILIVTRTLWTHLLLYIVPTFTEGKHTSKERKTANCFFAYYACTARTVRLDVYEWQLIR